ncbi:MAG: hypothetical protein LDL41_11895 [Coleofasciculus sp. S288]|nr:hypothetical protein [Coleofasciculus sp. S288]
MKLFNLSLGYTPEEKKITCKLVDLRDEVFSFLMNWARTNKEALLKAKYVYHLNPDTQRQEIDSLTSDADTAIKQLYQEVNTKFGITLDSLEASAVSGFVRLVEKNPEMIG